MLRVGSPSDQPFGAFRDLTATLLGFVTIPSDRDAWSFSLFYSPTSQLVFPIPGVAYVWRPSDQFQANLGIPFSLHYRPTETLTGNSGFIERTFSGFDGSSVLRLLPSVSFGFLL
jgi:hypothetical protein